MFLFRTQKMLHVHFLHFLLSAFCLGNYLTLRRRCHCAGNRALAEVCSIVSGRVLNRKRSGARITVEWESAEMP